MLVDRNLCFTQRLMDQRRRYVPALDVDDVSQTQDKLLLGHVSLDDDSGSNAVFPLQLLRSPRSLSCLHVGKCSFQLQVLWLPGAHWYAIEQRRRSLFDSPSVMT